MKLLIDMNLSPLWVTVFENEGLEAIHWTDVGDPRAPDSEIMRWARDHGYTVFTHDLDFGALLAASRHDSPSVIQVRCQNVTPNYIGNCVLSALAQFKQHLKEGALISINEKNARVRILPLK